MRSVQAVWDFQDFNPCGSIGFHFILFIRGAFAPVIRSTLSVGDSENHRVIAVQFIDYRIRNSVRWRPEVSQSLVSLELDKRLRDATNPIPAPILLLRLF